MQGIDETARRALAKSIRRALMRPIRSMVVRLIIKIAGSVLRLSCVSAYRIIYNEEFSEISLLV
jgi:hypothetical protein